jgi:hypothetical protein
MKKAALPMLGVALLAVVCFPGVLRAQWVPLAGPLDAQNFPDFLQDRMWDDIQWRQPVIKDAMRKQGIDPGQGLYANPSGAAAGAAGRPTRASVPRGTTAFRPGRRTVLDQTPPAQRPQIARALTGCDQLFSKTMFQTGVARSAGALNDVALSTAFYLSMSHYVYWDGQPGAPPEAQPAHMQYLAGHLRHSLVNTGRMHGKSDTDKQRAHDSLVLTGCIPLIQYSQAKKAGNAAAIQNLRAQAAAQLGRLGLSPTSMRFNPDGSVLVTPARRAAHRQSPGG